MIIGMMTVIIIMDAGHLLVYNAVSHLLFYLILENIP